MNTLIHSMLWGILSAGTVLYMAKETNRLSEGELPYRWEKRTAVLFCLCVAVSLLAGYAAAKKSVSVIAWILLTCCYMAVLGSAVIDWKLKIIPNKISGFLLISKFIVILYEIFVMKAGMQDIYSSLLGCILCFLILKFAGALSHGGIGNGDVKLLSALGFVCGIYIVFTTLILSLLCCAAVSIVLVSTKKANLKVQLPFGPFILAGYLGMIFFIY